MTLHQKLTNRFGCLKCEIMPKTMIDSCIVNLYQGHFVKNNCAQRSWRQHTLYKNQSSVGQSAENGHSHLDLSQWTMKSETPYHSMRYSKKNDLLSCIDSHQVFYHSPEIHPINQQKCTRYFVCWVDKGKMKWRRRKEASRRVEISSILCFSPQRLNQLYGRDQTTVANDPPKILRK